MSGARERIDKELDVVASKRDGDPNRNRCHETRAHLRDQCLLEAIGDHLGSCRPRIE